MTIRDRRPKKVRPGYRWEYRDGCHCPACPWRLSSAGCKGEDWPHWVEVRDVGGPQ